MIDVYVNIQFRFLLNQEMTKKPMDKKKFGCLNIFVQNVPVKWIGFGGSEHDKIAPKSAI